MSKNKFPRLSLVFKAGLNTECFSEKQREDFTGNEIFSLLFAGFTGFGIRNRLTIFNQRLSFGRKTSIMNGRTGIFVETAKKCFMEAQLKPFEEYIALLLQSGVFPTFNRYYNGWTCVLRNSLNRQIMPFDQKDQCWAETMIGALTAAVDGLNKHFPDSKSLHKYIATGVAPSVETLLQNVENFHEVQS